MNLCECGCGRPSQIAVRTNAKRGHVKGQPMRRLLGHRSPNRPMDPLERFWRHVPQRGEGCWLWVGGKSQDGYPKFHGLSPDGTRRHSLAHRWIYEQLVGPIPEGLTLDHVAARGCVSTLCVRPDHLEPVTNLVNIMRGSGVSVRNALKTHCDQGHEFTPENTAFDKDSQGNRTHRRCRSCSVAKAAAGYQRRKAAKAA